MNRESGRSARGVTPTRVAQLQALGNDISVTATGILAARVLPVGEVFVSGRRVAAAGIWLSHSRGSAKTCAARAKRGSGLREKVSGARQWARGVSARAVWSNEGSG